jgi:hypothetical protein
VAVGWQVAAVNVHSRMVMFVRVRSDSSALLRTHRGAGALD